MGGGRGGRSLGVRRDVVPALLIPGVVPFDETFGTLQLGMQTVLLAPVPGHTLGGDAETEQDRYRFRCLNNSLQGPDQSTKRPRPSLKFQVLDPRSVVLCLSPHDRVSLYRVSFTFPLGVPMHPPQHSASGLPSPAQALLGSSD